MIALSERDRKTLVLGALVVLGLVLFARGLPAWRRWDAGVRDSAREMADEAARAEATVGALAPSLDSLEARRARLVALGGGLLDGASPAVAGASLSSLVTAAGARTGVQVGSVQVRADTASTGTFVRVSARADGTGDLPAITRMLQALEAAPQLLAVREVSITQSNPGGPSEMAETLRVELVVEGLALARPDRALERARVRAELGDSVDTSDPVDRDDSGDSDEGDDRTARRPPSAPNGGAR